MTERLSSLPGTARPQRIQPRSKAAGGGIWRPLCTLLLALLLAEPAAAEQVVLQLKWLHQFQFAGYYAALEQGFYAEEGLEVDIREADGSTPPFEQVLAGEADFAIGDSTLLLDYLRGKPLAAVSAIFQHDPLVLIALESSAIENPYDLSGKRIMHTDLEGNEAQVLGLLAMVGLDEGNYTHVPHSRSIDDLAEGRVDVMTGYLTDQVHQLRERRLPVNVIRPSTYGFDFYGDILFTSRALSQQRPELVDRFNRASLRGWEYALAHRDEIVELIYQRYSRRLSQDVLRKEADSTRLLVAPGAIRIGELNPHRLNQIAETFQRLGWIESIDRQRLARFVHQPSLEYRLTEAERRWLEAHPVIRLGIDRDFAPYEWIDDSGEYRGLVADFFQLFASRLGVEFRIDPELDWQQTLDRARAGEIDLLSDAAHTPERDNYLDFTDAYFESRIVIISDTSLGYFGDLDQLDGRRVAIERGYFMQDILRDDYPGIDLVVANNEVEALHRVARGEADAYVGDAISLNYFIQQEGLLELRHSGATLAGSCR